ncbi:MAG: helix-turn-helix domain-containing protein [Spirochaetales bacterium]|nr:helix-turn-helix domain-containing protein [Spirochaetales bacterium]
MEEIRKIETYLRDREFPLALVHIGGQENLARHSHDYYELVYVVRGKGIHLLGENRFIIGESNIFLIPPGVQHGYMGTEALELYNVLFVKEEFLYPLYDRERMTGYQLLFNIEPFLGGNGSDRRMLFVEKEQIMGLLQELETSLKNSAEGWRYISRHLFDRIMFSVINHYLPVPRNSLLDRLGRIMPYIQEHLEEELTLSRLCEEGGMSRSSLTRTFQQVYGMSPMEKVRDMRVEKASLLLREGHLQIQTVAELCGFASSAYFCRVFREKTGVTPSEYRKELLGWKRQ